MKLDGGRLPIASAAQRRNRKTRSDHEKHLLDHVIITIAVLAGCMTDQYMLQGADSQAIHADL